MTSPKSSRLAVVLLLALVGSAAAQGAVELTPSGDPAPIPAVRLVDPGAADASRTRTFFGRVAARETVALSFEVGGRLVELSAREGEAVAAGEVVARLDPDPLRRAVERAELSLAQAERELVRTSALAQSNVASEVQAEDAATARDLADVALRDAREALADGVLRVPFDAIVAERIAATFTNVEPGQPIASLHDMSEVRVEIDMPERVLLRAGDVGAVAFEGELPGGDHTPLRLVEFEAQTGAVGQSFRVALAIPREAAEGLIPGASMTVSATLPPRGAGRALPASAILADTGRGFEVMVFRPDGEGEGTVERREVRVASPDGTSLAVEGLEGNERIVAAGGHLLEEGERVRVYDGLVVEEP